ncbi:MAG: twin-arginine translocation signal domain-containing protein [Planctomycetota bacterium]
MSRTSITRRDWLKLAGVAGGAAAAMPFWSRHAAAAEGTGAVEIGSRRELLVDDHLIDTLDNARRVLHRPIPREISLVRNKPWEGNSSGYTTVFQDGDLYRMYYRGTHVAYSQGKSKRAHREVYCYAESQDGINWTRPNLGLVEFDGSKKNNIIWDGVGSHNFTPFKDPNPDGSADAKYKAIARGRPLSRNADDTYEHGLYAFQSADGIHWQLIQKTPVITKGAFDSQNLAFWDELRGEYRCYLRDFRDGRDIRTCVSRDFVNWNEPQWLEYSPGRISQLYTNGVIPYYRAPHIFVGFPTRYVDHGWAESTKKLPQREYRELVASSSRRSGTAFTDGMLMSSRDGLRFDVWPESFIRPGIQRPGSWFYGDNYQNWGIVETRSVFEGAPNELSFYVSEAGRQKNGNRLRRYTLRVDGFVSVNAPLAGGELVTRPIRFEGDRLQMNFSTSAAGSIAVEVQDQAGKPIAGFALADCQVQYGDELDRVVSWKGDADLSRLAGKPVKLRFQLKDADLYAFRFTGRQGRQPNAN